MWILTEAIPRLFAPEMPHTEGMLGLAILGVF
jgi:cobalt-zinc-cadmium efflux system protein